jgi:hypothetical protein
MEIIEKRGQPTTSPVYRNRATFKVGKPSCKNHGEKHLRAFVKVVEGSEIYNFPIHHFVHFYSTFWSFTCSNRDTVTQLRPADVAPRPHRDVARAGRTRAALYRQPAHLGALCYPRSRLPRLRTSRDGHACRDTAGICAARTTSRGMRTPGLVAPDRTAPSPYDLLPAGISPPSLPIPSWRASPIKCQCHLSPRAGAPWPPDGKIRHRAMGAAAAEPPLHARPSPANRPDPLPGSPRGSPRRALPRLGAGLAEGRHAAPCTA